MVELQESAELNSLVPTPDSQLLPTPNLQELPIFDTRALKPKGQSQKPNYQAALGVASVVHLDMGATNWIPKKPYDLRERLFEFGCLIIRLVQFLHTQGPVAIELSAQILKAGTSAAANYEEADDGSGKRDEIAKKKIALRELKETRLRLRMLRQCNLLNADHDPLINESGELVRIVATVIRNAQEKASRKVG